MKKPILIYGAISGLIVIVINTLSIEQGLGQAWLGFLVMFIAFSSIFFAVKQFRDEIQGGVIRFGTGFLLGLGITAVASLVFRLPMTFLEIFPVGLMVSLVAAFTLRDSGNSPAG